MLANLLYVQHFSYICAVFSLLLPSVTLASKPVVAVFEIKNEANLDSLFLYKMKEVIDTQLAASGKFLVVPNSEIRKALEEKVAESYRDCYDEACQIEIGKQIAAEKTLATAVKRIGSQCIVTMQLFDLRKNASENAGTAKSGCDKDQVVEAIELSLTQLVLRKITTSALDVQRMGSKTEQIKPAWSPSILPKKVFIAFDSEPEGAVVQIDGKLICHSTPCRKQINAGVREVTMQKERYIQKKKRISLTRSTRLNFSLESTFGTVTITSEPAKMLVHMNGNLVGATPVEKLELSAGPYELRLGDKCHYQEQTQINIKPGKHQERSFEMTEKMGAYEIEAFDASGNAVEANLYADWPASSKAGDRIDDYRYLGKAPGTFPLNICTEEVVAIDDTERIRRSSISLDAKQLKQLTITFPTKEVESTKPDKPLIKGRFRVLAFPAPVRASGCAHMFADVKQRVILDLQDEVSWQGAFRPNLTWNQAYDYCENLVWAGYRDWGLPSSDELQTLDLYPDMPNRYLWSRSGKDGSTPTRDAYYAKYNKSEAVKEGFINLFYRHSLFDARCIRYGVIEKRKKPRRSTF